MKLSIRKGEQKDFGWIVAAQTAMARETENLTLEPAVVQAGVQAVIDDPHKGTYWMAELHGELVGMLLTVPEWSDWRNGTVLWIHSVYVAPEMRGKGVYKELYLTLKRKVEQDTSLRGFRLYVEQKNHSAQKVYEKLGMSKDHYFLYEWLKPRNW